MVGTELSHEVRTPAGLLLLHHQGSVGKAPASLTHLKVPGTLSMAATQACPQEDR